MKICVCKAAKKTKKSRKDRNIRQYVTAMLALVLDSKMLLGKSKAQPKNSRVCFSMWIFPTKDRFTDELLDRLLTHFETVRMRTCDVDSHILGEIPTVFDSKLQMMLVRREGEFYTPKEVVRLLVEFYSQKKAIHLYDPTCGSGGMLLEALFS